MKYLILLLIGSSSFAQQLPTGPLQFVKDTKTVTVKQDTVTPGNSIALPVSVFGAVTVDDPIAVTQSGVWSVGRTWSLLDSTDSISSFLMDGTGNAITSTAGALDVNVASGTITATNPSVSATGAAVPASATFIGANKSGNLTALTLDAGDNLNVNVTTSALPSGAATEVKQDAGNTLLTSIDSKITVVDTNNVSVTSSALPTGAATEATLSSVNTKIPSNLTVSSTRLLVDGSGVTQPISGSVTVSGTVAVSNPGLTDAELRASAVPVSVSSLPLPSGAATETTLSALNTKVNNDYGASSGAVRTASQIGNASGVADFGSGNSSSQTIRTVIASDQAAVATKSPLNTSGSGSAAAATVSTVITLTKPSNAVGFVLMNLDTSTANIRWALGRTATTTLGQQLQPGRDTGFIPASVDISLVAESGTQNYDVQWVSQ